MKVYKFGGGVLKDAKSLFRLAEIADKLSDNLLIVVSAFGKTTSLLERALELYYEQNDSYSDSISEVENLYFSILNNLDFQANNPIFELVQQGFNDLRNTFKKGLSSNKYLEYDAIVSMGEFLSANIVASFLQEQGANAKFADARSLLVSDNNFCDAKINWDLTLKAIKTADLFSRHKIIVSQGFTAATTKQQTTTLGREGSDYSASIFAYCLDAREIVFWKNVPGVLNADPNKYPNAVLLKKMSYKEAIEQTFYGAKILHFRTIKPLENKKIPIKVRSFYDLDCQGTSIADFSSSDYELSPSIPIYIEKNNQILFSIFSSDFSFITEKNISRIFALLNRHRLKVSLIQNSAISFSFCTDNKKERIANFKKELQQHFDFKYNSNLTLITIRHYDDALIKDYLNDKAVLIRQLSRDTARFAVHSDSKIPVFFNNLTRKN